MKEAIRVAEASILASSGMSHESQNWAKRKTPAAYIDRVLGASASCTTQNAESTRVVGSVDSREWRRLMAKGEVHDASRLMALTGGR